MGLNAPGYLPTGMRPWHTACLPASGSSWGLLEGSRPPAPFTALAEAQIQEFISLFFIPLLFRMKKVCSLLSSSHLPCYFSSPSGHLLLEISLQLLFPPYLVVYFFQTAKCKRKCCRRGFISKDRQIFNSTLTFIPWQHSTNKLTHFFFRSHKDLECCCGRGMVFDK